MIQKAAAMGNWWLAASSWQYTYSHISSLAEFFGEISCHPSDSTLLLPRFHTLWLLAFPKTKITFEREEFQTINEIQGNMMGHLMVTRRTQWGPKVTALKGTEASLSCVQCFLYLVSSSINVSISHITWLDTFWTGLVFSFTTSNFLNLHWHILTYSFNNKWWEF